MTEKQSAAKPAAAKPAAGNPEAQEPVATTVVARFDDPADAQKAFRTLSKTLRNEGRTIYEGAVVSRKDSGEVRIKDMRDLGLSDIILDATDATIQIGVGGLGLLLGMAKAGAGVMVDSIRLVRDSAGRVIGVTAEALSYPGRKLLSAYEPGAEIARASTGLKPGDTAIIVTADQATAAELATDLAQSGGKLL
jgi:uncharacterized membrane protein